MQPIRCRFCGYVAISDTSVPPRQATREEIAEFADGEKWRRERRQELAEAGIDPDDAVVDARADCPDFAHDFEEISNAEMIFGRGLDEELGRRPTRAEIRVAIRAAELVSEEETAATSADEQSPGQAKLTVTVGGITAWVHRGDLQDRESSIGHWQQRRLEKWRELMSLSGSR